MNQGMDEKEWLERIAGLPREVAPVHDPWPRIAARIGSRARTPRRWAWSAAAAVLLAVAAAWVFELAPRPDESAGRTSLATAGESPRAVPAALPAAVEASEVEYRAAFREFIPVGQSRQVLSEQAVEHIEEGWADLQLAEQALTAALAQRPADPFLNGRMLELRARQLGFLRQLAALEQDYRRLTI